MYWAYSNLDIKVAKKIDFKREQIQCQFIAHKYRNFFLIPDFAQGRVC